MLIDHGASLTIEDEVFHATSAGWLLHGLPTRSSATADYPQVARLLIATGATIAADAATGDSGVDAVLREHGLIVGEGGARKFCAVSQIGTAFFKDYLLDIASL
jgi:hypothetical protein